MNINTELLAWVLTAILGLLSTFTTKWAMKLRKKGDELLNLLIESADVVSKAKETLLAYKEAKADKKFTKTELDEIIGLVEETIKEFEEALEAGKKLFKENEVSE